MRRLLSVGTAVLIAAAGLVSPVSAEPLGPVTCLGFAGLDNPATGNTRTTVLADRVTLPGAAARTVGDGHGDIAWSQPFRTSAETWFDSLLWLGVEMSASKWRHQEPVTGEERAHVVAVVQDWARDHPRWESSDPRGPHLGIVASAAHRLQFLDCLRADLGPARWLDALIARHVGFLTGPDATARGDLATYVSPAWHPPVAWPRWFGPTNRGLDQSLAVLGAACALDRRDWYAVATRRIDRQAALAFDRQGVNNEQAPGYQVYNYSLWRKALDQLRTCGGVTDSPVLRRFARAEAFIALATRPDGLIEQLGDTDERAWAFSAGPALYAASRGTAGTVPTQRVGVFSSANGGYVLGHSGWGTARPYALETFYTLRFGAGRIYHGHDDHTSVTYWAGGQQVLVDGGHAGYDKGSYRDYLLSPAAHNVVTVSAPFDRTAATRLVSSDPRHDAYAVSDTAYAGVTRARSVLVSLPPHSEVMLVADSLSSRTRHSYDQLWHLGTQYTATAAGGRAGAVAADRSVTVLPIRLPGAPAGSVSVVRGQRSPVQGWVSKHYYTRTPASTVVVHTAGTDVRMVTAVVPAGVGAQVSGVAVPSPSGGWDLTVTVDGVTTRAHLSAAGLLSR